MVGICDDEGTELVQIEMPIKMFAITFQKKKMESFDWSFAIPVGISEHLPVKPVRM